MQSLAIKETPVYHTLPLTNCLVKSIKILSVCSNLSHPTIIKRALSMMSLTQQKISTTSTLNIIRGEAWVSTSVGLNWFQM